MNTSDNRTLIFQISLCIKFTCGTLKRYKCLSFIPGDSNIVESLVLYISNSTVYWDSIDQLYVNFKFYFQAGVMNYQTIHLYSLRYFCAQRHKSELRLALVGDWIIAKKG